MTKSRVLIAGAMLAVAGAAHAEFTVPITITSDYDFRGFTQTDEDPALQVGLNYSSETSGFYAGLWGSNVDFRGADPNIEIDAFMGYAGGDSEASFGYDVGAIIYAYPGSDDFEEVIELYAGLTKGWFGTKLWFSPDNYGDTSWYVEGNGTFPLPMGFSFGAHIGYSFGDYWDNASGDYMDYSLGFSKTVEDITFNVKWVDTDISGANMDRVILTFSTTLPWAKD